eukprot:563468-Amphidinium_carterae.1
MHCWRVEGKLANKCNIELRAAACGTRQYVNSKRRHTIITRFPPHIPPVTETKGKKNTGGGEGGEQEVGMGA